MTVSIYIYTDIKGPRRKAGTAMYVLEAVHEDKTVTRTGMIHLENATATEAELRALRMASERFTKSCSVQVFTKCGGIFAAYKNGWLNRWRENGWKNAKGEPVAHTEDWKAIDRILGDRVEVHLDEEHTYRSWMEAEVRRWNTSKQ